MLLKKTFRFVLVCLCGVAGLAYTAGHRSSATAAQCTALDNYPVGARAAAHVAGNHSIEPPASPWRMAGNIILAAYSSCGQQTAGTFSVQGELMGTPLNQGGMTVIVPCGQSCMGPSLATITAQGTFRQDSLHERDPLYVSIDGALTVNRARYQSHVAFHRLMGYLIVRPGHSAKLLFLPPPALRLLPDQSVNAGVLPVPVVIYGWIGM